MWIDTQYNSTALYNTQIPIHIRYYPSSDNSSYIFFDDDGANPNSIASKKYQAILFKAVNTTKGQTITVSVKNWPMGSKRKLMIELPIDTVTSAIVNGKKIIPATTGQWQRIEVLFEGKPVKILL